ncbi:uncharacterized protein LOC107745997 [Sinocyclocheilus rhinocerous]|uniref:uncharacterized protein LOC107745997 n=1 Tax=Sinocyclocheilus rhinocerous TaxID=307959 RepID=UPI0007B8C437|nr:PREDICTED: uncharacterized protein LOC107745997 [Sinocyclocheilus rhinocerous]
MVQKVLQELKQYHGAKHRTSSTERKEVTGNFTWYEFLTIENDGEEEERPERLEKGTKVKRTLSSLRNRMTGSFNKDKKDTKLAHADYWESFDLLFELDNVPIVYCLLKK